ncbi:MAG TPA: aminotransferase class V-fold PLP-dependent enzyme [Gemmatimonadaceae bacterium]|nr:aminotransferase class V-fold PLP-dependent enzyme [Gemmatimonadaceae bacterium]
MPSHVTLASPSYDIDGWRSRIPILAHAIPMNNCSQAPQSEPTREAADAYLESWARDGMDWDTWVTEVERARASFARLINADVDEVAVTSSVSHAVSALASALRFDGARNRVVASAAEFPTVGHVWLAQEPRGADVHWVPLSSDGTIELAEYAGRIDDRTRVVSAAHAYFANGFKQDIGAIARAAHEHDALLFVDAYQTLGTEPIDVRALGVDALAGGTLKYLMACAGVAFLYVRRELAEQLRPTVTGWFGRVNPFAFDAKGLDWAAGARRFDGGTPPIINAYIARAGLEIIHDVGPAAIGAWTRVLSDRLVNGGRERGLVQYGPADSSRKSPSTAFIVGADSAGVERDLRARAVIASARGTSIRLAPHFYSTLDDVDQALDALAAVLGDRS